MRQDSPSHHRKHMIGTSFLRALVVMPRIGRRVMPVAFTAQSTQFTMSLVPTIK